MMQGLKTTVELKNSDPPYLYSMYNLKFFYMNLISPVQPMIVRLYNALVQALNENEHLPKFIIVIPDKNIIEQLNCFDCGINEMIEDNLSWLFKNISQILLSR